MILDKLENSEKYVSMNPLFSKAFEFLKTVDPSKMGSRVELDSPDCSPFLSKPMAQVMQERRWKSIRNI